MSGLDSTGSTTADLIAGALMALGALLVLLGSIGINRFPHFYSRLHAAGVIDTLASGVFLLGVGVFFGVGLVSVKLLLIFVIYFTLINNYNLNCFLNCFYIVFILFTTY